MEEFVIEEEPTIEATFQMDVTESDHNLLENRDLPNQHPMGSITGLETALDNRVDKTSTASQVYGTDSEGNQTTYDVGSFGQVDDVQVGGVSVVTNKIAELGTMAGEAASDYSTKAVADTLYADISYEGTIDNHIADKDNPHEVTKTQVGLGNVDNTSDLDKPISTATQTALDGKQASLSSTQLQAVNSGANTTNIGQIATNTNDISAINEKIPNQASSSNQLADKEFVNSSISTNTANFIGTFNSTTALEAYSGTVTNNDYAFVTNSVITDNGNDWATFAALDAYNKSLLTNFDYGWVINGNKFDLYRFDIVNQAWVSRATNIHKTDVTLNSAYNRYKATVASGVVTWEYEYTLNNSSFTASQWTAINSGITSDDVSLIATALQPNDNVSSLTNDSGYLVSSDIATGSTNGTISVNGTDVSVYGLGSAAYTASSAYDASGSASTAETNAKNYADGLASNYATAAQGSLADTALQPNDNISELVNDSGYITGITSDDVTTALGYTPYSSSNPNGYTSNVGTVTSVNNVSPVSGNVTLSIPAAQVNSDWNVSSGVAQILNKPNLATVATSGAYSDLSGTPTIPTVNDATLTIQKNGTTVNTFSANASSNVTANITVPTQASDIGAQATLVSGTNIKTINGTSLLGSGDISVGSSVSVDGDTINTNSSDELQAVGLINPRDGNAIKIWQGNLTQWTNGEATTWYNWQTTGVNILESGSLPRSGSWKKAAYGNNTYIAVVSNYTVTAYSTDGGATWSQGGSSLYAQSWQTITYGNGKFVALASNSLNAAYTDDNGATWNSTTIPLSYPWQEVTYGNGKFVAVGYNASNLINKCIYSEDGINWSEATLPGKLTWRSVTYGNNKFIAIASGTDKYAYSTDGINWSEGTFPTGNANWQSITYGNGKFVAVIFQSNIAYYSEDGINWSSSSMPSPSTWASVACSDGKFVAVSSSGTDYAYSLDGINWKAGAFSTSANRRVTAGGNNFLVFTSSNTDTPYSRLSFTSLGCFTLDETPTTSSTVYSAPETASALTITSVGSGSITLSDTFTYDYIPSGNQFTYRTIGDAHPDWICNINDVGVRIGTTDIATNSPIVSSVSSLSTNDESTGAKLFYDTVGDIETLLQGLR